MASKYSNTHQEKGVDGIGPKNITYQVNDVDGIPKFTHDIILKADSTNVRIIT